MGEEQVFFKTVGAYVSRRADQGSYPRKLLQERSLVGRKERVKKTKSIAEARNRDNLAKSKSLTIQEQIGRE